MPLSPAPMPVPAMARPATVRGRTTSLGRLLSAAGLEDEAERYRAAAADAVAAMAAMIQDPDTRDAFVRTNRAG